MAKVSKTFRLEEKTVKLMDKLIPVLSKQEEIELNRTKLIELLVADRYAQLVKKEE